MNAQKFTGLMVFGLTVLQWPRPALSEKQTHDYLHTHPILGFFASGPWPLLGLS